VQTLAEDHNLREKNTTTLILVSSNLRLAIFLQQLMTIRAILKGYLVLVMVN